MSSLRARMVALCVLVAVLCTALCALAASRALTRGEQALEEQQAIEALTAFDARLEAELATVAAETESRSKLLEVELDVGWDAARARLLAPADGELIQLVAVARGATAIEIGYAAGGESLRQVVERDPGKEQAAALLASAPGRCLTSIGGQPALAASAVSAHGDRVLGLAFMSSMVANRLTVPGWELRISSTPATVGSPRAEGTASASPSSGEGAAPVSATRTLATSGGPVAFTLSSDRIHPRSYWARAQAAIVAAGLATAAVAALLGGVLAWAWMRPLRALVDACRARARGAPTPLPRIDAPEEAAVLRDSLQALLAAEQGSRQALAQGLERETTVNAVHQRFLAQLAHEFAQPIRALTGTIQLMHSQGGRLDPERLAEARDGALRLEERFQEVLGLAADHLERQGPQPRIAARGYLTDLSAILRPQADRLGVAIIVEAPDATLGVDARLLSPVLVNLAANGLRAAAAAGRGPGTARVVLRAMIDERGSSWQVEDNGLGIPEPLATRVHAACASGEVMPAEPGMGLGLALALANTRALGGALSLRSSMAGTTFDLRLPSQTALRASTP